MVQMIAYGNERTITQPGWRVRVRNKSTAMLMPSGGAAAPGASQEAAKPTAKDGAKGLLRGLFGRCLHDGACARPSPPLGPGVGPFPTIRSAERRVGKVGVSTCTSRWS